VSFDPGSRVLTLQPSTNITAAASTAGVVTTGLGRYGRGLFMLDVTDANTAAGDTLDVYLQKSPDGGTTWTDFVAFTQVLGNGGAIKHIAEWTEDVAVTDDMHAVEDAALSAGVNQGPIGDRIRVKHVGAEADTIDFTFSVTAIFNER